MTEITKEDIEWWEEYLIAQNNLTSSGYYPFVEHLLKLAKAVKELQGKVT